MTGIEEKDSPKQDIAFVGAVPPPPEQKELKPSGSFMRFMQSVANSMKRKQKIATLSPVAIQRKHAKKHNRLQMQKESRKHNCGTKGRTQMHRLA